MKMQTLSELEYAIGGRPKMKLRQKKIRLSFYLNIKEAALLKKHAEINDVTVSQIVRELLKPMVNS
ncbi:MAG: hypothetical protein P8M49_10680 [Thalassotalea sp.]|nr:hypothetical protein [Thalassotalea sp.]MDG2393969.1 hypothetical protein [Thalassotalea sp.]